MGQSIVGYVLEKYLAPYFSNFSRESLKMSFTQGEASMENLIFDEKITGRLPFPLKVKFGRLGKLNLTLPSYWSIVSSGIKIHI